MPHDVALAPMKTTDIVESHTKSWSPEKQELYHDYIKKQRRDYEPRIEEKDRVIIEFGKGPAIVAVRQNVDIKVRNHKVKVSQIIDHPFHTVFALENGTTLKPREGGPLNAASLFSHIQTTDVNFVPTANNSELFDDASNQTLSHEEIAKMKAEGKSGDEIIRAVAAASKTFDSKTEFSQEKWLRKKLKKYNTDISTKRPTPAIILKTMSERESRRILNLRDDTLGQLMLWANIGAGQNTMIVENAGGLILGTAAYRQGGYGNILSFSLNNTGSVGLLDDFNLSHEERKSIIHMPLASLRTLNSVNPCVQSDIPNPLAQHIKTSAVSEADENKSDDINKISTTSSDTNIPGALKSFARGAEILKHGADSLIVCTSFSPKEIVCETLPYLRPSSPFVVYSPYPEALSALQLHLVANKLAINVQIFDTWYRPYQILPNRTHPLMTINATGGYILIGTSVVVQSSQGDAYVSSISTEST